MVINNLPCTACVHKDVCSYKEKYVNYITEVYPAIPPCDLYKHGTKICLAYGKDITLYDK